ncbi:MAG: VCBS repeat-containing protein [Planctomycetaceae bacterium]|nr:VCBS repeat-containing protein [Planctomycetaceae bacterium]
MNFDWLRTLRSELSPLSRRSLRRSVPRLPHMDLALESRTLLSAIPIGQETIVSYFSGSSPDSVEMAMDADGDYVITWSNPNQDSGTSGIFARQYNAAGIPQGPEFRVNTFTTGTQIAPDIAMDDAGNFVIVWESHMLDGTGIEIFGQRYDSAGAPQGGEFHVNTWTTNSQSQPSVAMDADGDFVVTWSSLHQATTGLDVYGQRYDSNGVKQGGEFLINTTTFENQAPSRVTMDQDGDFVVVWNAFDGNDFGVFGQRFNALGTPQGTEFLVNTFTSGAQRASDLKMDAAGNFVVLWETSSLDMSLFGVFAQRYNAAGTPLGPYIQVNTWVSKDQSDSSLDMQPNGDFVVTWTSFLQDGSLNGVYAQSFFADGQFDGVEFQVHTTTTGHQHSSAVAVDDEGDFVIVWLGPQAVEGNSGDSVMMQRYRESQSDDLGVWRSSGFYLDANHSDTWNGTGLDTLNGFGIASDTPLVGDWNGDGFSDIGVWRNGIFYLDANGNGVWDGASTDRRFNFGISSDTPLVGDWNNDGFDDVGVWRSGKFYLDLNGNQQWDSGLDAFFSFGSSSDTPIIGDWNADGVDDVGVWRAGKFYLDANGNRAWNSGVDAFFSFGISTDKPIIGDWNGDGMDDPAVWRTGKFYLDLDGNRTWNSGTDAVIRFGSLNDSPLIGYWKTKAAPPPTATLPTITLISDPPLSQASNTATEESAAYLVSLIAPQKRKTLPTTE